MIFPAFRIATTIRRIGFVVSGRREQLGMSQMVVLLATAGATSRSGLRVLLLARVGRRDHNLD